MSWNLLTQLGAPVRRRSLVLAAAAAVALAGLWAGWHHLTNPPQPWMVRWQVLRFLKKNSISSSFHTEFPFPSKAEMAKGSAKGRSKPPETPKGKLTGKDFDLLAQEYIDLKRAILVLERDIPAAEEEIKSTQSRLEKLKTATAQAKAASSTNAPRLEALLESAQKRLAALEKTLQARPDLQAKQTALAPVLSDLWDFQRMWAADMEVQGVSGSNTLAAARAALVAQGRLKVQEARSYEVIYKVIGQYLWVAERLLASLNPEHRRVGVSLAMDASRTALNDAQNGWLAGRVVEGFVWPHLDVADDTNRRSPFNLDNLLGECADIFRRCDDTAGAIRNYEMMLAMATTPQRADLARSQIAMAHEQAGNLKEALGYLRQIKLTNDFRWAVGRISRMERQLQGSR
jgi:type II secretory pathway component PulJ